MFYSKCMLSCYTVFQVLPSGRPLFTFLNRICQANPLPDGCNGICVFTVRQCLQFLVQAFWFIGTFSIRTNSVSSDLNRRDKKTFSFDVRPGRSHLWTGWRFENLYE